MTSKEFEFTDLEGLDIAAVWALPVFYVVFSLAMIAFGSFGVLEFLWFPPSTERNYNGGLTSAFAVIAGFYFLSCSTTIIIYLVVAPTALRINKQGISHFACAKIAWTDILGIQSQRQIVVGGRAKYTNFKFPDSINKYISIALEPNSYKAIKYKLTALDRLFLQGVVEYDDKQSFIAFKGVWFDCDEDRLAVSIKKLGVKHGLDRPTGVFAHARSDVRKPSRQKST